MTNTRISTLVKRRGAAAALLPCALALGLWGCGAQVDPEDVGQSVLEAPASLQGCHGKASSAVPSNGSYYLTTFGASASDDGQMSCGTFTKHGSWYYAASRQRYGCKARIKIEANGRCVVAQTDDYGPDVCVENAAGGAIMDVSPLVSRHLFGVSSAGWSEHRRVRVTKVSASTALGPCS